MRVLVTGAAGFIGMHAAAALLARGDTVVGLDNLNDYYDVSLKAERLSRLTASASFSFERLDLSDRAGMAALFERVRFDRVLHLGAQAGVRHSLTNPLAYVDSNLCGFAHVLEGCRAQGVEHLVYASSSSVYGGHTQLPYSETHSVDHPVSLYAATKKANEAMAHSYSHLFGLPTTALRFFTVYGPWGRPDMAPWLFADAMLSGRPIQVFNQGMSTRDFTFIDDVVDGVLRVLDKIATPDAAFDSARPDPSTSSAPWRVFNIGHSTPVPLKEFISTMEQALGVKAVCEWLPAQPGDVPATHADTSALQAWVGYSPPTPLDEGVRRFTDWFRPRHRR